MIVLKLIELISPHFSLKFQVYSFDVLRLELLNIYPLMFNNLHLKLYHLEEYFSFVEATSFAIIIKIALNRV